MIKFSTRQIHGHLNYGSYHVVEDGWAIGRVVPHFTYGWEFLANDGHGYGRTRLDAVNHYLSKREAQPPACEAPDVLSDEAREAAQDEAPEPVEIRPVITVARTYVDAVELTYGAIRFTAITDNANRGRRTMIGEITWSNDWVALDNVPGITWASCGPQCTTGSCGMGHTLYTGPIPETTPAPLSDPLSF